MVGVNGLGSTVNSYDMSTGNTKEPAKDVGRSSVKSSEDKLSSKAANYLSELRKSRGDFDFIVANPGDDYKSLVKQSNKEYTVIYSSAEVERMANDPKYAAEKTQQIETILSMTKKICEQEGYVSTFGKKDNGDAAIKNISVSVGDDGKMKIFAELEKISEKQKERIEKAKEKKAEEKKHSDKPDKNNPYNSDQKYAVKRTTIEASSMEEFWEKIKNIDWSDIKEEWKTKGGRFDYSI